MNATFKYHDNVGVVHSQSLGVLPVKGIDMPYKVKFVPAQIFEIVDGSKRTEYKGFQRIISVALSQLNQYEDFIRSFLQADSKSITYQGVNIVSEEVSTVWTETNIEDEWFEGSSTMPQSGSSSTPSSQSSQSNKTPSSFVQSESAKPSLVTSESTPSQNEAISESSQVVSSEGISSYPISEALPVGEGFGAGGVATLSNIFAGSDGGGIYYSSTNGATWTIVNTGLGNLHIYSFAVCNLGLFVGTASGVYFSNDNGATWVSAGMGGKNIFSLAISGTNLFAGTDNGIFLSPDNGTSWIAVNLTSKYIFSLVVFGTNLFAGTDDGIFMSINNGTSWTSLGFTHKSIVSIAIMGSNIIVIDKEYGGGVFLSSDNGLTWNPISPPDTSSYLFQSLLANGTDLFAGTLIHGIYKTLDNGTSWNLLGMTGYYINCFAVSGSHIFVGTDNSGIFASDDNGATWHAVNIGLVSYDILSIIALKF